MSAAVAAKKTRTSPRRRQPSNYMPLTYVPSQQVGDLYEPLPTTSSVDYTRADAISSLTAADIAQMEAALQIQLTKSSEQDPTHVNAASTGTESSTQKDKDSTKTDTGLTSDKPPNPAHSAKAIDKAPKDDHEFMNFYEQWLGGPGPFLHSATAEILKHPIAEKLLDYYLHHTVAKLHPQQGADADKNSARQLFLGVVSNYPTVLNATLALAAFQLAQQDHSYINAYETYKSNAVSQLAQQIQQGSHLVPSLGRFVYSLEFVASLLSLMTLAAEVSDPSVFPWKAHCDTAHAVLADWPLSTGNIADYLRIRLFKYVYLAEIAEPTRLKLALLETVRGDEDELLGVPAMGLQLAAMISRYVSMQAHGHGPAGLASARTRLEKLLVVYSQSDRVSQMDERVSGWRGVQETWCRTVLLFHRRVIQLADCDDAVSVEWSKQLLEWLQGVAASSSGRFRTTLAFPALTIAPLLRDWQLRTVLILLLTELTKTTLSGTFGAIASFARLCWFEMDTGRCKTQTDVDLLAKQTGYLILAA